MSGPASAFGCSTTNAPSPLITARTNQREPRTPTNRTGCTWAFPSRSTVGITA